MPMSDAAESHLPECVLREAQERHAAGQIAELRSELERLKNSEQSLAIQLKAAQEAPKEAIQDARANADERDELLKYKESFLMSVGGELKRQAELERLKQPIACGHPLACLARLEPQGVLLAEARKFCVVCEQKRRVVERVQRVCALIADAAETRLVGVEPSAGEAIRSLDLTPLLQEKVIEAD